MSGFLPGTLCSGSGAFIGALKVVLDRKRVDVAIFGFNPWPDNEREAERVLSGLLDQDEDGGSPEPFSEI